MSRSTNDGHGCAASKPRSFFVAHPILSVAALLLCFAGDVHAGRPPLTVPSGPDVVIERLPAGYAALSPHIGPATPARTVAEADTLLAAAARTGDSRLAARADALLARLPANSPRPDVIRARAFSAQHRHDFDGAVVLLDRLIAREPRDGDARMSRAQIHLVQGRLDLARADCTSLVLGVNADDGLLCTASLALRRGETGTASALLDRWLAQAPPADPRRGYATVMRAEAAARSGDADAERWFRQALAGDPDDVKTLAAYARYLRAIGRDRDVEALLAATDADGLQLQRALAANAAGAANAAALADAQARRYATAHAVGSQPEMRDEAEFLLTLRRRPAEALALAQRNFGAQRDYEDVDLLIRAARAAGAPDAVRPLQAWARAQGIALPDAGGDQP